MKLKKIFLAILIVCMVSNSSMLVYCEDEKEVKFWKNEIDESQNNEAMIDMLASLEIVNENSVVELGKYISAYDPVSNEFVEVYPVFVDDVCKYMFFCDQYNNATLTEDVSIYEELMSLTPDESEYFIYSTNGNYYAENDNRCVKLTDNVERDTDKLYFDLSYEQKIYNIADEVVTSKRNWDENNRNRVVGKINGNSRTVNTTIFQGTGTKQVACSITDFVQQYDKPLCWAAASATVINYKIPFSGTTAQSIADELNVSGNGYPSYIRYALMRHNLYYQFLDEKISWSGFKLEIDNDNPVIIDIYKLTNDSEGHVLVGYGYRCGIVDNVITSRIVCAWDPNGFMIYFRYNADTITTSGYTYYWCETIYKQ